MGVESLSWKGYLSNMRQFLAITRNVGLTLNLKKCDFAKPEVIFVGQWSFCGFWEETDGRIPEARRGHGLIRRS